MNKRRIVKYIEFDFTYNGQTTHVILDHTINNCQNKETFSPLYEDEIYDDDPAWCTFDMPDGSVIDFQVHDADLDGILGVDACQMYEENGVWCHGDFLDIDEYSVTNIKLIY